MLTLASFPVVGIHYRRRNLGGVEDFLAVRGSTAVSPGLATPDTFVAAPAVQSLIAAEIGVIPPLETLRKRTGRPATDDARRDPVAASASALQLDPVPPPVL